ncbi:Nucleotidylyl transferase [Phellopilus nigrolimitatus]|nr:Nucleotidylyl transferase [Phellopilus nigrolimitatus]
MAPLTPMFTRSILILKTDNLHDVRKFSSAISKATRQSTDRLLIIIFCELLNADVHLSRTRSWRDVQTLLTCVYVEATRVSQDADRILMDVDVLLRGLDTEVPIQQEDGWQHVFRVDGDSLNDPLPTWILSLPITTLAQDSPVFETSVDGDQELSETHPTTFPVVALGGTFDHLHSGHKILLSMAAWIAHKKVIVGVTDDNLLQKKSNKEVMEPLDVRIERVRRFIEFFKQGLSYEIVPIGDVYGPTAVDPNIQALVVSKETLGGASAIAKHREAKNLPALTCFVIDVISMTTENLDAEDMEMLRKAKMSSTFIREWIVRKREGDLKD